MGSLVLDETNTVSYNTRLLRVARNDESEAIGTFSIFYIGTLKNRHCETRMCRGSLIIK